MKYYIWLKLKSGSNPEAERTGWYGDAGELVASSAATPIPLNEVDNTVKRLLQDSPWLSAASVKEIRLVPLRFQHPDFGKLADERGWSEATIARLCLSFMKSNPSMWSDFMDFLLSVAEEEDSYSQGYEDDQEDEE